ncbi:M48 family metallopeptidase [Sinosporangium siamense]|uniref:Ste24 endopeptidase n=1 Tax=Sinosporangium siamense TaxID=1367973 RepID=A0A919RA91_9ACTN|nr:M48 family metallopeptidase [Sinosporangium siamense]GII90208.1 Ste24 endopeptidase [Sinosporangium siamense]
MSAPDTAADPPPAAESDPRQPAASPRGAGIGVALLGAALVAVVVLTTPWRALPAGTPVVPAESARDFTAAQIARSAALDTATSVPAYLSLGLTLIVAGLLTLTPFGTRLLGRLRGPWWVRVPLGVLAITVVTEALRWPLGMWMETYLRDFGLSTQAWPAWSLDRLMSLGVRTGLLAFVVLVVVALARRLARWWIPAAAGVFLLTVGASFVYPVVFEPLFNDFRSMPAGQLRDDLLAMAARDGVPVSDVLVADASRRTTALNAYVSGFGATKRIVVYDTLLKAPVEEVRVVVAHELGHAKHDDVLYGTLIGGLGAAFGTCLLAAVTSTGFLRRRTGIASLADPRAAGLVLSLISIGTVLSGPAQNLISRQIEGRADVHALDLTRDPATFVAIQQRLATTNLSDLAPDPLEYVLYFSHPPTPERIAIARSWALLNRLPQP